MEEVRKRDQWLARWKKLPHPVRWIAAACVGGSLVVVGLIFLVLPGPGIPLVILGLVILASEFAWAQAVLHRARTSVDKAVKTVKRRKPEASAQD